MEFRYRMGDASLLRRYSPAVSGAPPLRGGLGGLVAGGGVGTSRAAGMMHLPSSGSLALRRELQKERIRQEMIAQEERIRQEMIAADNERIRQEMIAQEMAVRRELEEEVRREFAMECLVEDHLAMDMEIQWALREAEIQWSVGAQRVPFVEQLVQPPVEAMRAERRRPETFRRGSEFGVRSDLLPRVNPTGRAGIEMPLVQDDDGSEIVVQDDNSSEIVDSLPAEEVKLMNDERPAIKRKGPAVAGSRKIARIDKHRVPKEGKYTYKPKGVTTSQQSESKSTILVDGKPYHMMKNKVLLCEVCGVTCNSTTVMATHLAGKKHRAREEELSIGEST